MDGGSQDCTSHRGTRSIQLRASKVVSSADLALASLLGGWRWLGVRETDDPVGARATTGHMQGHQQLGIVDLILSDLDRRDPSPSVWCLSSSPRRQGGATAAEPSLPLPRRAKSERSQVAQPATKLAVGVF